MTRFWDGRTDSQTDGQTDGVTALLDLLSPSATQVKKKSETRLYLMNAYYMTCNNSRNIKIKGKTIILDISSNCFSFETIIQVIVYSFTVVASG